MEAKVNRVLYVNSEMVPFLSESEVGNAARQIAQGIQEQRIEIRSFLPRYGLINERKNQLHEVIRLSGMNLVIGDVDRPLIIKVASLPAARMQVYFIDNDDYFKRKALYADADGNTFKDNGQRAIFYARGVLETVKKLRWSPDIIHCNGWISHLLPLYLKKCYKDDPIFSDSLVVLDLFGDAPSGSLGEGFLEAVQIPGVDADDIRCLGDNPCADDLAQLAIANSDGIIFGSGNIGTKLVSAASKSGKPVLDFNADKTIPELVNDYKLFYENLR